MTLLGKGKAMEIKQTKEEEKTMAKKEAEKKATQRYYTEPAYLHNISDSTQVIPLTI